jgi:hypothetical protein
MLTALLLTSLPAMAIGTFGPASSDASDFAARAMLIQDGESTVAAVQIDPEAADGVTHWIIPVPGEVEEVESKPMKFGDDEFESFLAASDPMYLMPIGLLPGCGGGCVEGVGDTGELAEVRIFDADIKGSGLDIRIFLANEMDKLIGDPAVAEFQLSEEQKGMITGYGSEGWQALLVTLGNGVSWDKSTPLIVYRYSGSLMALPMALSTIVVDTELQVLVTVVANQRMNPAESAGVEPRLGLPAYRPEMTRKFYNARVRVAIEEAGGHAWVLEYANTLEALNQRHRELENLDTEDMVYAGIPENPSAIFDAFKQEGLLSENFGKDAFVTRWRTYIDADELKDEPFIQSPNDETYEVFIDAHGSRPPSQGALWFPLVAMGWLMRRRRE